MLPAMTVLGRLGEFAATASIAGRDEAVRSIQHRHVFDTVVALVAGLATEEARSMAVLFDWANKADKLAFLSAATRLTEIDDIDCLSCTTPSSITVPLALGMAGAKGNTPTQRIADAIWVGTEIVTRLGGAINGPTILQRGIWPTRFCAPVGAAATMGRLYGFDEPTMANALSVALQQAVGAVGRQEVGPSPRWLLFSNAVKAGIFAARAAQEGFGGDPTLLDAPHWLDRTQGITLDISQLTDGLGETSVYETLSLKPYCCAKQAVAAVEGFRSILSDGVAAENVHTIEIRVPPPYAGMISRRAEPGNRLSTLVSASFQCALAAWYPDLLYDIERSKLPWDDKVSETMAKVTVVPDEALLVGFPRRFPAAVTVHAIGGPIRKTVEEAWGDPGCPLNDRDVFDKAHRILIPLVGENKAKELVGAAASGLTSNESLGDLMRCLEGHIGEFRSALRTDNR